MLQNARSKLFEITGVPSGLLLLRAACAFNIALTPNTKKIKLLGGCHTGRRAFVIGNGPSLKIGDLDYLKNEITFAANKIHLAFALTDWRPTYHFIESEFALRECLPIVHQFSHQLLLSTEALSIRSPIPNALYYSRDFTCHPHTPLFQRNPLGHTFSGYTVLYSCLQFAYFMGITEVYLIGVDFNYKVPDKIVSVNALGTKVYSTSGEPNYFHSDYKVEGQLLNDPNIAFQEQAYLKAKQVYSDNDRSIYNATRGGKLSVFPRVEFDSLFPKGQ